MRRYVPFATLLALLGASTCSSERKDSDVLAWFAKGRVGSSQDVGLYKASLFREGEFDYIATIHGMDNDMNFCVEMSTALKARFPDAEYSCRLVN